MPAERLRIGATGQAQPAGEGQEDGAGDEGADRGGVDQPFLGNEAADAERHEESQQDERAEFNAKPVARQRRALTHERERPESHG